eukprot:CAMPEP_0185185994 /NCGR_PEP_ID=MMETSP1140-20130426/3718_1 /TAXON_ID=298111 /ORGANISM="Pavlova sp., Strain CCMP459" /LENGTH=161 /DNA_ID=CAMNT_0027752241 /DNA_START=99 /DNA_END=581 /DNA_ORIENTATION=-
MSPSDRTGEGPGDISDKDAGAARRTWTTAEDQLLEQIVQQHGARQWARIAEHMGGVRKDWQCRERWQNHLRPQVKKGSWSKEEDEVILRAVQEIGTKWSGIKARLPGRTGHAVKNRYHSICRRVQRGKWSEEDAADEASYHDGESETEEAGDSSGGGVQRR